MRWAPPRLGGDAVGSTAYFWWRCGGLHRARLRPGASPREWRRGGLPRPRLRPGASPREWRCGGPHRPRLRPGASPREWRCGGLHRVFLVEMRWAPPRAPAARRLSKGMETRWAPPPAPEARRLSKGMEMRWAPPRFFGGDAVGSTAYFWWRCGGPHRPRLRPGASPREWRCGGLHRPRLRSAAADASPALPASLDSRFRALP